MQPLDPVARRAGRIAFGAVLWFGAFALVRHIADHDLRADRPVHAWHILTATWLAALLVGGGVTGLVQLMPRSRDRDALRVTALTIPATGMALLLPLTIHMPIVLAHSSARGFDEWCALSLLLVGHTHIVFAVMVYVRARRLTMEIAPAVTVKRVFVVSMIAAVLPSGVLWGIAPAVVALTSLPILPLIYRMETIAERDRQDSRDVPFAIARIA